MLTNNNKLESESVFPRLLDYFLWFIWTQCFPRARGALRTLGPQKMNLPPSLSARQYQEKNESKELLILEVTTDDDQIYFFSSLLRSSCPEGVSRSACKHVMIGSDFDQLPFLSSSLILDYSTVLRGPHRCLASAVYRKLLNSFIAAPFLT